MDEKNRRDLIAPAIAALFAGILVAYIAGYFLLGQPGAVTTAGSPPAETRVYRDKWQANLFTPGAIIESWLRGRTVYVGHRY